MRSPRFKTRFHPRRDRFHPGSRQLERRPRLSTHVLGKSLEMESNWNTQKELIEEYKHRKDVYDIEPLLRVAVDGRTERADVRQAAIECAAVHNTPAALEWLQEKLNRYLPKTTRILAIRALAMLQIPNETLPILEDVAMQGGAWQVRSEAIRWIGIISNLRSVEVLLDLQRDRGADVVQAADEALEHLIEKHGGRAVVVQKMVDYAQGLCDQGRTAEARAVLRTASRLDPYNWTVRNWLRRLVA